MKQIGISRRRWFPSLLVSLIVVWRLIPRVLGVLSNIPAELVLPPVIFNSLCFWEPFFVFCWIQLRFERAFGVLPGILAAGLCL